MELCRPQQLVKRASRALCDAIIVPDVLFAELSEVLRRMDADDKLPYGGATNPRWEKASKALNRILGRAPGHANYISAFDVHCKFHFVVKKEFPTGGPDTESPEYAQMALFKELAAKILNSEGAVEGLSSAAKKQAAIGGYAHALGRAAAAEVSVRQAVRMATVHTLRFPWLCRMRRTT